MSRSYAGDACQTFRGCRDGARLEGLWDAVVVGRPLANARGDECWEEAFRHYMGEGDVMNLQSCN